MTVRRREILERLAAGAPLVPVGECNRRRRTIRFWKDDPGYEFAFARDMRYPLVTFGLTFKLEYLGWIEHFQPHVGPLTWRITDAGRAALQAV